MLDVIGPRRLLTRTTDRPTGRITPSSPHTNQNNTRREGMEAAAGMVRELLQLLLAFTGHAACVGVALPTLELWVYLPEMLGLL